MRLNPVNEIHRNEKSDANSLSFDDVWVIHQDKKGRIWIGTDGGGLNLFDETNGGRFYRMDYRRKS